jgi:hypothetical protein
MSTLIFSPTPSSIGADSMCWEVIDRATGELCGTMEWHHRLGAYGFAASPGRSFLLTAPAAEELGAFLDKVNRTS